MRVYVERYTPEKTIKLVGTPGSMDDVKALALLLYYAAKIEQVVK